MNRVGTRRRGQLRQLSSSRAGRQRLAGLKADDLGREQRLQRGDQHRTGEGFTRPHLLLAKEPRGQRGVAREVGTGTDILVRGFVGAPERGAKPDLDFRAVFLRIGDQAFDERCRIAAAGAVGDGLLLGLLGSGLEHVVPRLRELLGDRLMSRMGFGKLLERGQRARRFGLVQRGQQRRAQGFGDFRLDLGVGWLSM